MKKVLLILLPFLIGFAAFGIYLLFFSKDIGKGALQVTSLPESNVYLNGKLLGKTPLCKCESKDLLATGEYTIRLVPLDPTLSQDAFEQKITITKSVLTVVDRTFGQGANTQGSVISLSPSANSHSVGEVYVASFPSGVNVALDGQQSGTSPVSLQQVTESDHDLLLSKMGYKDKHIRIHAVKGYKLSVIAFLAIDPDSLATSSATLTVGSSSASLSVQKVVILNTPTGFLRVRSEPSLGGAEIAQVKPGEYYELLSEQDGWYQIKLSEGKNGWINNSYAKKQ